MPELPEVEVVKKQLHNRINGQKIAGIKVISPKLKYVLIQKDFDQLVSSTFTDVKRLGKYLIFNTTNGDIISHLGMTGSWILTDSESYSHKHSHLMISLSSGKYLFYDDVRKFGFVVVDVSGDALSNKVFANCCKIDAISDDFSFEYFKGRLSGIRTNIKTTIMNNNVVMGIGNIYACEALFLSNISPILSSCLLSDEQIKKLLINLRLILKNSIELGGSSLRNYKDTDGVSGGFQKKFLVYGRSGQPCSVCGSIIKSIKQQGRTTFFCPACQK